MLHLKSDPLAGATLFLAAFSMALWGATLAHPAQNAPAAESGQFSILSGNRLVGTEKFKITPLASGVETIGELQLDVPGSPRTSESCFLRVDGNLRPTSYERQQKSPKKGLIIAQFGFPESKLSSKTEAGTEDRIFFLPDNHLVVLDTNFFHHYALLLRQYDPTRPGPQHFNVFIPQETAPGTISLELQGKENQTVGKTVMELNHFEAMTDQVKIEIWAAPSGGIYRISIPQANLEVVRQESGKGLQ